MLKKSLLDGLVARFNSVETQLATGEVTQSNSLAKLSREHARLALVVEKIHQLERLEKELLATQQLVTSSAGEQELFELAKQEELDLQQQKQAVELQLVQQLLPSGEDDDRGAILEIRSGIGGEEAALFAKELLTMYQRYCQEKNWKMQILHLSSTDLGGIKEISVEIVGKDVFANLKLESGVHRVQRVPVTESSGRIHTSAATVAVLPIAEETDLVISPEELRIDVYRSSGPGGQSVNKTDSAVRITHLPSGTVACCQDEKSQHRNRASAMKILRSRIYEIENRKKQAEKSELRRSQVGTGDRSERIRTFNFPQNRVTDHRIGLIIHDLEGVLAGNLDPFIKKLRAADKAKKTAVALKELEKYSDFAQP